MKKTIYSQEILLQPDCGIFKKEFAELNKNDHSKMLSNKEKLSKLCWDGMLPEILPEICEINDNGKCLTLWEINETGKLLDLRFGEFEIPIDNLFSINPFIIITNSGLN